MMWYEGKPNLIYMYVCMYIYMYTYYIVYVCIFTCACICEDNVLCAFRYAHVKADGIIHEWRGSIAQKEREICV